MFIPRQPVVDNQFCEYVETDSTGGVGGAIAHAGAAVFIGSGTGNTALEALVTVFDGDLEALKPVFGLLMQKIKTGYHQVHPAGYLLSTDFGSSDAHAQPRYDSSGDIVGTQKTPVGVAHDGGIWDTTHYTSDNGAASYAAVEAGDLLWVHATDAGRLTSDSSQGHAYAEYPMYGEFDHSGTPWGAAAIVIKGVSAAKAEATHSGQTLYPIRIKLLV
jgi:hypothetical protein